MKTSLKTIVATFFTIALAGCDGTAQQPTPPANTDNHHQGEANVMPHGHDEDNPMQKMMDDHHAEKENVEPHGHGDDSANLPPSRSRLEGANDDHHAGEENVAPHND